MILTRLSLRRPVTAIMAFVCLTAVGLTGAQRLPLEFLPDIEYPGLWIQIGYRNSSPEEVERRITRPVEESLATLTGVTRMYSESRDDGTGMWVQFGWNEDLAVKGVEARDKLDALRDSLPDEVQRPQIFKFNAADQPIMIVRISADRDLSGAYDMLNRNLKRRVERLAGVSRVELYGVEPKEIRIELNANRVAAHGVDLGQLTQAMLKANFALAAGRIDEGSREFLVRPDGRFSSVADIENYVIDPSGLTLKDIADVRHTDPVRTYGRHLNRRYAIGLNVFKETGANMVAVADRVLEEIEAVRALPEMQGVSLFVMHNQAEDVRDSLDELILSGLIGALLSLMVLYAFLREWRMTLIVTMAVPLSLVITLGAMFFLGYTLNILTLMGLMLSVGMLVDNGVVVTESIYTERGAGAPPVEATLRGTQAVGLAVAAGTLTTAIVFLPNIFGERNDLSLYLSHVAVTICMALAASLLVALTLIPQLTSRIAVTSTEKRRTWIHGVAERYTRLLRWSLRHGGWMALFIVAVMASVYVPATQVKADMFPQENSRRLFLRYNLNGQYALDKVEESVDRIEAYLFANQERFGIESVYSFWQISRAESTILLLEDEAQPMAAEEVKRLITEELPKIAIGDPSFDTNRSGSREKLAVRVYGEKTERLTRLAHEVSRVLKTVDGLTDIRVDAAAADWEVQVGIDRERVARHGLSSQTVAQMIATAMRGQPLKPMTTRSGESELVLQFSREDRSELDRLLQLPIRTPAGELVALSSLATLTTQDTPGEIKRHDRRTSLNVQLGLEDEMTPEDARKAIKPVLDAVEMPPGYGWDFGNAFDEDAEQAATMVQNMLLAVACIYIVMAALFESVLAPTAIITGIAFSFVGVYWFFLATGTTFSFMAMIGMLVLMGIVVNNGIVLIDHVSQLRRAGMTREDAMFTAARERLRPILMTVGTTVLGMVPLALGDAAVGGNGPPYYPMARAIIGGLVFSTVVSLLVLPSIYLWLDDLANWGRRVAARARGVPVPVYDSPGTD